MTASAQSSAPPCRSSATASFEPSALSSSARLALGVVRERTNALGGGHRAGPRRGRDDARYTHRGANRGPRFERQPSPSQEAVPRPPPCRRTARLAFRRHGGSPSAARAQPRREPARARVDRGGERFPRSLFSTVVVFTRR
jgi:hypothetical protein